MAYLKGSQKLVGSIGDLNYYEDSDGRIVARNKGGASKQKFETSENMALTRDFASEFSSAAAVAGKIRGAFHEFITNISDTTHFNRLVALLTLIGRSDFSSDLGHRHPFAGSFFLLEDFQWNAKLHLGNALKTELDSYIDPFTGDMQLEFGPFVPLNALKAPGRASHFQLIARGRAIHPKEDSSLPVTAAGPLLPIDGVETGIITLPLTIPKGKEPGLFILSAAVIFFEEEEGVWSGLRGGAAAITRVEAIQLEQLEVETDDAVFAQPPGPENLLHPRDREALLEAILKKAEVISSPSDPAGPVMTDPELCARHSEASKKLKRTKWLQRLDKYRYG